MHVVFENLCGKRVEALLGTMMSVFCRKPRTGRWCLQGFFPRRWAPARKRILLAWANGTRDPDLGLRPILKASVLGMENIP